MIGSIDYNKNCNIGYTMPNFFLCYSSKIFMSFRHQKIKESWKSLNFKTEKVHFYCRNCVMIERLEKSFIKLTV